LGLGLAAVTGAGLENDLKSSLMGFYSKEMYFNNETGNGLIFNIPVRASSVPLVLR
jgi:hypothetical protein